MGLVFDTLTMPKSARLSRKYGTGCMHVTSRSPSPYRTLSDSILLANEGWDHTAEGEGTDAPHDCNARGKHPELGVLESVTLAPLSPPIPVAIRDTELWRRECATIPSNRPDVLLSSLGLPVSSSTSTEACSPCAEFIYTQQPASMLSQSVPASFCTYISNTYMQRQRSILCSPLHPCLQWSLA